MTAKVELLEPTLWFKLQELSADDFSLIEDAGVGPYTGAEWRFRGTWLAQQDGLTPHGDPCVYADTAFNFLGTSNSTYGIELTGADSENSAAILVAFHKAPDGFTFNLDPSTLPDYDGLLIADDSAQFSTTDAASYLKPTALFMVRGALYSTIGGHTDEGTHGKAGDFCGVYRWDAGTLLGTELTYTNGTTAFSAVGGAVAEDGRSLVVFTHSFTGAFATNKVTLRHVDALTDPLNAVAPTTSTTGAANEAHESTSADAGWWYAGSGVDNVFWSGRGYKTTATSGGSRTKVYKNDDVSFPPNDAKVLYSMDVVGMPAHAGGGGFSAVQFNGAVYALFSVDTASGVSVLPLAENLGESDLYDGLTAANLTYIGSRVGQLGFQRSVFSNGSTISTSNGPLSTISHGYGILQVLGSRMFLFMRGMHRIAHTLDAQTWSYTDLPAGWDLIGVGNPLGAVSELPPLHNDKLYFLAQNRFVAPRYQLYAIDANGVITYAYTVPALETLTACTDSVGAGLVAEYTDTNSSHASDRNGQTLRNMAAYFRTKMGDGKWDVYVHAIPRSAWLTPTPQPALETYFQRLGVFYRWRLGSVTTVGLTEASVGLYTAPLSFSRTGGGPWVQETVTQLAFHTAVAAALRMSNIRLDTGVSITPALVSAGSPNTTVDAYVTVGAWVKCAVGGTFTDFFLSNDSASLGSAYYGVHVSVNTSTGVATIRYGDGSGTGTPATRVYTTSDTGIRADGAGRSIFFQTRVVTGTIDLQPILWVNGTEYACSYSSGSMASVSWPVAGKGAMFGAPHTQVASCVDCTFDEVFIHFGRMTTAEVQALHAAGVD